MGTGGWGEEEDTNDTAAKAVTGGGCPSCALRVSSLSEIFYELCYHFHSALAAIAMLCGAL